MFKFYYVGTLVQSQWYIFRRMYPCWWIMCLVVSMVSMAHCDMASMQGMSDNEEQGRLMDRDIRAPFNDMRGKRLQADQYDIYNRVSF